MPVPAQRKLVPSTPSSESLLIPEMTVRYEWAYCLDDRGRNMTRRSLYILTQVPCQGNVDRRVARCERSAINTAQTHVHLTRFGCTPNTDTLDMCGRPSVDLAHERAMPTPHEQPCRTFRGKVALYARSRHWGVNGVLPNDGSHLYTQVRDRLRLGVQSLKRMRCGSPASSEIVGRRLYAPNKRYGHDGNRCAPGESC